MGLFGHLSGGKDYPRVFTSEEEDLADHISKFAQLGFPFTTIEMQALGFEYAEEWGIEGFSSNNESSQEKVVQGFYEHTCRPHSQII